jgi:hypothetical protein
MHILPRLMIFLYIGFFVYVVVLLRRLVLAVEGIARKIEGAAPEGK